jgi:hypothetical protein
MRRALYIVVALLLTASSSALCGSVPQEPENDNPEYLLDIVTNEYSRRWREVWDGGDNRFRFRLGSNKVTQWFLEEELKLAAPLVDRVRFRFHHARLFRYTTEEIAWDVLEFEGRIHDRLYLSLYGRPTLDKREGALGFILQQRRAVNRYVSVSVEWPGFMRNYFEHHRDTSDSLLNVFTDRPVRFALDARERILPRLWVRVSGEYVPSFEMGEEVNATGEKIPKEEAGARALVGWIEYASDPSSEVRDQMAFGIEAAYQRSAKSKDVRCGCGLSDVSPLFSRRGGGPAAMPQGYFEQGLYESTDEDTVRAWRDERVFVSPYAWVPINDRIVLNGALRYEWREIGMRNHFSQTHYTANEYVVPRVGISYALGLRRQYVLEGGFVSEFRTRSVERVAGSSSRVTLREEDFDDHRLYLAFEYVFGESNMIRLTEGFELDAEDRGQFGIHDHGFFQVIIGF